MGGRGSTGGAGKFGKQAGAGLSKRDIERANAASIIDMGDIINRTFERNIAEINGLSLSDNEKKDATTKMKNLATNALKTAAGAVNPYSSGPARLTTAQKTGSAADRAAKARGEMDSFMQSVRSKSSKNKNAAWEFIKWWVSFSNAFVSAQKSGALEVTVNGKTYRRANRRSSTWRPV